MSCQCIDKGVREQVLVPDCLDSNPDAQLFGYVALKNYLPCFLFNEICSIRVPQRFAMRIKRFDMCSVLNIMPEQKVLKKYQLQLPREEKIAFDLGSQRRFYDQLPLKLNLKGRVQTDKVRGEDIRNRRVKEQRSSMKSAGLL